MELIPSISEMEKDSSLRGGDISIISQNKKRRGAIDQSQSLPELGLGPTIEVWIFYTFLSPLIYKLRKSQILKYRKHSMIKIRTLLVV